jgi:hypothetical protein
MTYRWRGNVVINYFGVRKIFRRQAEVLLTAHPACATIFLRLEKKSFDEACKLDLVAPRGAGRKS